MGRKGEGRPYLRLDHIERRQGPTDVDGGGSSKGRPRYYGTATVVRLGAEEQFRGGRRHREGDDRQERPDFHRLRIYRQGRRPLDGRTRQLRERCAAAVRA